MARKRIPITARLCETRPEKRLRVYCTKVKGFFVSITPRGVATFYFRYWDDTQGKQIDRWIGDYSAEHLTVDQARAEAQSLAGRVGKGEDIAAATRQQKVVTGKTVTMIDEYLDDIKTPVKKADGEKRPRVESWQGIEGYLNRFARPRLGKMVASEVSNDDIAKLQNDIVRGKFGTPSVANARNARTSISGLFNWAMEAGRKYVKTSPCVNLPKLDPEHKRDRVLTPAEIKTLWWGLDHPDVPCSRSIALAIKFELVTMLRTKEFLKSQPPEFLNLNKADAQFQIPLKRVKARRVIVTPLNDLAQGILAKAITDPEQPYVFAGKFEGQPLDDKALGHAVSGYKDEDGNVIKQGIRDFLGMAHWTPHDLRRTAATLAGDLEFTDAEIARCLDHSNEDGEDAAPTVTGVYVRSKRIAEKRKLLDAVGAKLTEIIGKPPHSLKLVA
jgi:integrase